jgi:ribosomal protein L37AE/L43A
MFTENTRPICEKCKTNPALSLLNDMWICGNCMHEYIQKQIKAKQELFLRG